MEGGGIIYISLNCHHQNDSCIKMGSDESHFHVSLIVRERSLDSVHKPQLLKRKESRSGIEWQYLEEGCHNPVLRVLEDPSKTCQWSSYNSGCVGSAKAATETLTSKDSTINANNTHVHNGMSTYMLLHKKQQRLTRR